MKWQKILQNIFVHSIYLIFNIATVFGLTTFYYSGKHKAFVESKFLTRYCKFMGFAFIVLYPVSLFTLIVNPESEPRIGVTDIVRNSIFVGNWLLCSLIFLNQTSYSTASCQLYNQAGAFFVEIVENQCETSPDDISFELNFSAKCVLKTCFLVLGFFLINIAKFYFRIEPTMTLFESVLFFYLFVPSFVMFLASNRYYVATTFCLYLIMKINNSIRAVGEGYRGIREMGKLSVLSKNLSSMVADTINSNSKSYARLHQLFIDFNSIYAKYIILILGFCFMNVVFEVK